MACEAIAFRAGLQRDRVITDQDDLTLENAIDNMLRDENDTDENDIDQDDNRRYIVVYDISDLLRYAEQLVRTTIPCFVAKWGSDPKNNNYVFDKQSAVTHSIHVFNKLQKYVEAGRRRQRPQPALEHKVEVMREAIHIAKTHNLKTAVEVLKHMKIKTRDDNVITPTIFANYKADLREVYDDEISYLPEDFDKVIAEKNN